MSQEKNSSPLRWVLPVVGTLGLTAGLLGLTWAFTPKASEQSGDQSGDSHAGMDMQQQDVAVGLVADHADWDLGEVSMAKGKVSHDYLLKNETDKPIELQK